MRTGLYIHVPFCERKCLYCDFCSVSADNGQKRRYIDAVIAEAKRRRADATISTLFIGGGTPTCLESGEIKRLVDALDEIYDFCLEEFTVEGNPNSFTEAKLDEFISCGMTRCSMGVQSLQREELSAIGRLHTAEQAISALSTAIGKGVDVSVDIMVGLPYQTVSSARDTARRTLDTGIGHLSCYSLILEEGTPLAAMAARGKVILPDEDMAADMYEAVRETAAEYGLKRYEISNFGKPCLHNCGYWQMDDYIGLGASAHSLQENIRSYNTDDIERYIMGSAPIIEETLSVKDKAEEYLMLSLRMTRGADMRYFERVYGKTLAKEAYTIAARLREYLIIDDGRIAVKEEYAYISNGIIAEFIS